MPIIWLVTFVKDDNCLLVDELSIIFPVIRVAVVVVVVVVVVIVLAVVEVVVVAVVDIDVVVSKT